MTRRVVVAAALAWMVGCGGTSPSSRVRAEVKRLEGGRDVKIEIDKAKLAPVDGLELYHATVLVPDHPGYRCAVHGKQAWCSGDDKLQQVVKALGLGAAPDRLTDEAWLDLTLFLLDSEPLRTAGKADRLASYAPAEAQAAIAAPGVSRDGDGVHIRFFTERISYMRFPSGPKSLVGVDVLVAPSDAVRVQIDVVWDSTTAEGDIDDIEAPDDACAPLGQAIVAAAEAGAACTSDDECAIRDVGLCNTEGLGCYWVAYSTAQSTQPLDDAIEAYIDGCPRLSKCDCAPPPTTATCRDGRCTGTH